MKTSSAICMLSVALVAPLAAAGCIANPADMAEPSVVAPVGDAEGEVATAAEALLTGTVIIKNVNSQKALNVFAGDTSDSAPLIQWPVDSGLNEQFHITPTSDGAYTLTAGHSGKCLDLFGGNTMPGASIAQWACEISDHQKFLFESSGG